MKKAWPWIAGLLGAVAYFTYFETMVFIHPDQYDVLSHVVSTLGAKWPLPIFLMGFFAGGLSVHFFWLGKSGG